MRREPLGKPMGEPGGPAGYAGAAFEAKNRLRSHPEALRLASRVLADPVLMQRLGDRVYELMADELRDCGDRDRRYGGW